MLPLVAGAVAIGIFLVDTISTLEIAIAVVYVVVVLIAAVSCVAAMFSSCQGHALH